MGIYLEVLWLRGMGGQVEVAAQGWLVPISGGMGCHRMVGGNAMVTHTPSSLE